MRAVCLHDCKRHVILSLDFPAMILADWIMSAPWLKYVLQVAHAVQVIANAIRNLNIA